MKRLRCRVIVIVRHIVKLVCHHNGYNKSDEEKTYAILKHFI